VSILRRLLAYGRAVLKWDACLDAIRDWRKQGQIPTSVVVRSVVAMCLCRLGSLNALGQTSGSGTWRRWLGRALPSPDTIGRVAGLVDLDGVRAFGHHLYERLKRGKALNAPAHGLIAAVVDGHELHASYKRHCPGCLERKIQTANGERIQYYHRLAAVSLVLRDLQLMLDAEAILPGEDEVAAALRLLERVVKQYPRAFDLVQGDALYADSRFFNWAIDHGKHALAVLKDDRRDLLQDARRLFEDIPPSFVQDGGVRQECRDLAGFTTWPQVKTPVRVVASRESRTIRRQLDGKEEELVTDWFWVTTLPKTHATTGVVVRIGHGRWGIENQGFNELVNEYHADHVYRHEPTAIVMFWLMTQLCMNVFMAFFIRNLKPAVQKAFTMRHVARLMLAELYLPLVRAPT
jgi:hypothetical protein